MVIYDLKIHSNELLLMFQLSQEIIHYILVMKMY